MANLNADQLARINEFLNKININELVSDHLQKFGLSEFKITSFQLDKQHHAVDGLIHICPHGLPAKQVCTISGSCNWVCDH